MRSFAALKRSTRSSMLTSKRELLAQHAPAILPLRAILPPMKYYLSADIGGTNMRAASFAAEGVKPLRRAALPTHGKEPVLERLKRLLRSVQPDEGTLLGIGAACPGPLDPERGIVLEAPNIPEWHNLPLKALLEAEFGAPVVVDNDANLAALGEWRHGAGRGHHHVLYLTISTGIGAGVIVDDHLLHGARGLAAELGHVTVVPDGPLCGCGQRGHLEAVASGTAIARMAAEALAAGEHSSLAELPHAPTAADVAAAARAGDPLARRIFAQAGAYLGRALADFLHVFNPTAVILGGGVTQAGAVLLNPLEAALRAHVMTPAYLENLTLTTAALGDDAGLLGALEAVRAAVPPLRR